MSLRKRGDGDRFKPTDTAKDIAAVLVGMFTPSKAADIAREPRPTTQRPKDQAQRRWRAQAGAARARDDRPARGGGAEA
jgi:hypothetical protein